MVLIYYYHNAEFNTTSSMGETAGIGEVEQVTEVRVHWFQDRR